jgi:hypothetical protein
VTGQSGMARANEDEYPYVVELVIQAKGLDVAQSRQIMHFHKSRRIQQRYGRTMFRGFKSFYRWCFSDLGTARAFIEQFGGEPLTK